MYRNAGNAGTSSTITIPAATGPAQCARLYLTKCGLTHKNENVLDIDYYHLVFTCPGELNPLIYCNQKELYSLFFHAVAETILELSEDPVHMGATPGFISIMHTWGSNLSYHPHIHYDKLIIMGRN